MLSGVDHLDILEEPSRLPFSVCDVFQPHHSQRQHEGAPFDQRPWSIMYISHRVSELISGVLGRRGYAECLPRSAPLLQCVFFELQVNWGALPPITLGGAWGSIDIDPQGAKNPLGGLGATALPPFCLYCIYVILCTNVSMYEGASHQISGVPRALWDIGGGRPPFIGYTMSGHIRLFYYRFQFIKSFVSALSAAPFYMDSLCIFLRRGIAFT